MSQFFEDTMTGLLQAVDIKQGRIPMTISKREIEDYAVIALRAASFVEHEASNNQDKTHEHHLEEFAENGFLTEDGSKFPKYRIREAALLRDKLGRPLTDEEMKLFEIAD